MSAPRPSLGGMDALTEQDREVLAFEQLVFRFPGEKDTEIRERFGISPWRYAQRLNALLDNPAAEAAEPVLVHRLQRLRADRRRGVTRILR